MILPLAILLALHTFANPGELIPNAVTLLRADGFYELRPHQWRTNFGGPLKFNLNRSFGLELRIII